MLRALGGGGGSVAARAGVRDATVVDASRPQLDRVAAAAGPDWPRLRLVQADEEEADLGEGTFDGARERR